MGGGRLPDADRNQRALRTLRNKRIIDVICNDCGYLVLTLEDGMEITIEATLWSEILKTKVGRPFLRMRVRNK